jgi:hypothetical protein
MRSRALVRTLYALPELREHWEKPGVLVSAPRHLRFLLSKEVSDVIVRYTFRRAHGSPFVGAFNDSEERFGAAGALG